MLSEQTVTPVVLVVEDEWLIRLEIAEELRRAGWRVLETDSGENALQRLRQDEQIDLLILDIRLAGKITGWDVAEAFRAAKPDLPVIYASAYSPNETRQVPGSLFFDKPVQVHELLDACRNHGWDVPPPHERLN